MTSKIMKLIGSNKSSLKDDMEGMHMVAKNWEEVVQNYER